MKFLIEVDAPTREDAEDLLDDCEFNFREDTVGGKVLTVDEYLEKRNTCNGK